MALCTDIYCSHWRHTRDDATYRRIVEFHAFGVNIDSFVLARKHGTEILLSYSTRAVQLSDRCPKNWIMA